MVNPSEFDGSPGNWYRLNGAGKAEQLQGSDTRSSQQGLQTA